MKTLRAANEEALRGNADKIRQIEQLAKLETAREIIEIEEKNRVEIQETGSQIAEEIRPEIVDLRDLALVKSVVDFLAEMGMTIEQPGEEIPPDRRIEEDTVEIAGRKATIIRIHRVKSRTKSRKDHN